MEPVAIALTTVGWLISTLINKAFTSLLEAWAKRVNLGKEFVTLKKELTAINATLTSGRGLETTNNDLLVMLKDLQQLAYEADDLLDELDYYRLQDAIDGGNSTSQITGSIGASTSSSGFKLTSRRILSIFRQCCRNSSALDVVEQIRSSIPNRITMSSRMNELVEKLKENNGAVQKALNLEANVITSSKKNENHAIEIIPYKTTSYISGEVFGRNRELEMLNNMIVGEEAAEQILSIIAIVGHGGVGKTTLARSVYRDTLQLRRSDHFDLNMWVTVSDTFDVGRIMKDILLESDSKTDYRDITVEQLPYSLEKSLKEKKYLLVLDDLWEDQDEESWDWLLAPLKNSSKKGNVVLLTTRKPGITKLDGAIKVLPLDGLQKDAYWSLFKKFIFGNLMHTEHLNMQTIAQKIAEKLMGNPLAAKTMGALLRKKFDESHWKMILEKEEWKRDDKYGIMPALRISYKNLIPPLQCCFSYCALFPKDYKFEKQLLVNLWAAQSLLDEKDKRMEEVGELYIDSLVDSGFFEKIEKENKEHVYVIHDLLHDLAQNMSSEECLSVLAGEKTKVIPQTIRHLSIISHSLWNRGINGASTIESFGKELTKVENKLAAEKLSTIMHTGRDISRGTLNSETLEKFQNKFKDAHGLRVLRLSEIPKADELLSSLHSFTHLRYLKLSYSYSCNILPTVICCLYHLQVLDVRSWFNLEKIPNNFSNLINLRHFIVHQYKRELHSRIASVGKLANIQELYEFKVRKETEFSIEQLRELNELGEQISICNLENLKTIEQAKGAVLDEKQFLNGIYLSWDRENSHDAKHTEDAYVLEGLQPHPNLKKLKIKRYGGATSPTWLKSLTSLEKIQLNACVALEILPPLGQLQFLKKLRLSSISAVKEIGPDFYGAGGYMPFQHLEEIELTDLPKLEKWVSDERCQKLPALSKLVIKNCPELDLSLPCSVSSADFNERFPNMKDLRIEYCAKVVWLSPLPLNGRVVFYNIGSFKKLELDKSLLLISEPCNPNVWHEGGLFNLRTRTITYIISSEMYPCPWDNFLNFPSLRRLEIMHCDIIFSFPYNNPYNQISRELKDLKFLHLSRCGITGKCLTWMLHHMPMLSEMELQHCYQIKSIEVAATFTESAAIELNEDESLLKIPDFLKSLQVFSFYNNFSDLVFARNQGLSGLVSLRKLKLTGCRLLSSLLVEQPISNSLLPPGLQELWLENPPEDTSLLLNGLSSLTRLTIENTTELRSLDFTSCVALEEMKLLDCEGLTSLNGPTSEIGSSVVLRSREISSFAILAVPICTQLKSLQKLSIQDKNAINMTEEQEEALKLLTSLKYIIFLNCTKLQVLPAKLHLIHSLEKLELQGCGNIQSIPENGLPISLDIRVIRCGPEVDKLFREYKKNLEQQRHTSSV